MSGSDSQDEGYEQEWEGENDDHLETDDENQGKSSANNIDYGSDSETSFSLISYSDAQDLQSSLAYLDNADGFSSADEVGEQEALPYGFKGGDFYNNDFASDTSGATSGSADSDVSNALSDDEYEIVNLLAETLSDTLLSGTESENLQKLTANTKEDPLPPAAPLPGLGTSVSTTSAGSNQNNGIVSSNAAGSGAEASNAHVSSDNEEENYASDYSVISNQSLTTITQSYNTSSATSNKLSFTGGGLSSKSTMGKRKRNRLTNSKKKLVSALSRLLAGSTPAERDEFMKNMMLDKMTATSKSPNGLKNLIPSHKNYFGKSGAELLRNSVMYLHKMAESTARNMRRQQKIRLQEDPLIALNKNLRQFLVTQSTSKTMETKLGFERFLNGLEDLIRRVVLGYLPTNFVLDPSLRTKEKWKLILGEDLYDALNFVPILLGPGSHQQESSSSQSLPSSTSSTPNTIKEAVRDKHGLASLMSQLSLVEVNETRNEKISSSQNDNDKNGEEKIPTYRPPRITAAVLQFDDPRQRMILYSLAQYFSISIGNNKMAQQRVGKKRKKSKNSKTTTWRLLVFFRPGMTETEIVKRRNTIRQLPRLAKVIEHHVVRKRASSGGREKRK